MELNISDLDWDFICENRFLTPAPTQEMLRTEFISGTGITEKKKDKWPQSSELFAEYIEDLRDVQDADINGMARELLGEKEKAHIFA